MRGASGFEGTCGVVGRVVQDSSQLGVFEATVFLSFESELGYQQCIGEGNAKQDAPSECPVSDIRFLFLHFLGRVLEILDTQLRREGLR